MLRGWPSRSPCPCSHSMAILLQKCSPGTLCAGTQEEVSCVPWQGDKSGIISEDTSAAPPGHGGLSTGCASGEQPSAQDVTVQHAHACHFGSRYPTGMCACTPDGLYGVRR